MLTKASCSFESYCQKYLKHATKALLVSCLGLLGEQSLRLLLGSHFLLRRHAANQIKLKGLEGLVMSLSIDGSMKL